MPLGDAHDDCDDARRRARLDRAGFEAIDLVGGAVFDVAVRYLREDPWERMRLLSSWVTETPLIIHTRGQSLFTFEFFADDVVELAAERFVANGIRYHTPYDALNDMRNLEIPIRAAKRCGLYVVGGLVYTYSPVHTDRVLRRQGEGTDSAGRRCNLFERCQRPFGSRTYRHVGAGREGCHWRLSASICTLIALPALLRMSSCRPSHTVLMSCTQRPRRWRTAHPIPPPKGLRANLRRRGYEVALDLGPVDEVAERLAYIARREGKPSAPSWNTTNSISCISVRAAWSPI